MLWSLTSPGHQWRWYWTWASYQLRTTVGCAYAGNARNVFPVTDVHHARAVVHVGIANPRWRGKHSRHSRRMRNTQLYVSVKRPMQDKRILLLPRVKIQTTCAISVLWNYRKCWQILIFLNYFKHDKEMINLPWTITGHFDCMHFGAKLNITSKVIVCINMHTMHTCD